jgi:hypothetical protein
MPRPVEEPRGGSARLEANIVAAEPDGGRIAENILGGRGQATTRGSQVAIPGTSSSNTSRTTLMIM